MSKLLEYLNNKVLAMRLVIADEAIISKDFPISVLRDHTIWILNKLNRLEMNLGLSTIEKAIVDILKGNGK